MYDDSEIFNQTNPRRSSFHPAQNWIDDCMITEMSWWSWSTWWRWMCAFANNGILRRVAGWMHWNWWRCWCWLDTYHLPKPLFIPMSQGGITEVPIPLLLMWRPVYSPSARSHIKRSVPRRLTRWARGSSPSSRAKVTSVNSHCECHLPSVKVKYLDQLSRQWNGRSSLSDCLIFCICLALRQVPHHCFPHFHSSMHTKGLLPAGDRPQLSSVSLTLTKLNFTHFGTVQFIFFFFDIPSSLLLRIDYHQMLSFQESVGHITCTLWSSPQLSTYDFSF